MDASKVVEGVKSFITREILEGDGTGLDQATPLLEQGLINSMSMVMLVKFIHNEYGVDVPTVEMKPANFGTIDGIANMVVRLKGKV